MKKVALILFLSLIITISCKEKSKTSGDYNTDKKSKIVERKKLEINLNPKSDSGVTGNAIITEEDGTVKMVVLLSGLTPGSHAIHLHEKSDCTSPDGTSAGGHWNPTAQPHGKWGSPNGFHKGDVGNFTADENGHGILTFKTDQWCIGCDDENKNIVGKSIIVHAGEDDFKSQPTGAAGGRVSCGGIIN